MNRDSDAYFDAFLERGLYADVESTAERLGYKVSTTNNHETWCLHISKDGLEYQALFCGDGLTVKRMRWGGTSWIVEVERAYDLDDDGLVSMGVDLIKALLKRRS